MSADLEALLAEAEFPEREVKLCLRGSLYSAWEKAQEELEKILEELPEEATTATAGQLRERRVAAEKVQKLEKEIEEKSITLKFRAIPFLEYNQLAIAHPPRKDNKSDSILGWNSLTFIPELVKRCVVGVSSAQLDKLFTLINDRQFDALGSAAMGVNRSEDGSVPFSQSASETMRAFDATSKSRGR